jgi:hypothetical protein
MKHHGIFGDERGEKLKIISWLIDPSLDNDRETNNETTAVT